MTKVLKEVFLTPGTAWMLQFLLFYKLCERAEMTFSMYLVDKQVSTAKLAAAASVMKTCSMIGSMFGGYQVATKGSTKQVITTHSVFRALAILLQFLLVVSWGQGVYVDDNNGDWVKLHLGFFLQCVVLFHVSHYCTFTMDLK